MFYDVLTSDFRIIPCVMAMSEVDAMELAKTRYGVIAIDATESLNPEFYISEN